MGEANENRFRSNSSSSSRAMEGLYLEINRHPRDLLQRFMSTDAQQHKTPSSEEEDKEEIELNLGLSLGGRFGVDKTVKKLKRASSIAGSIPLLREHDVLSTSPVSYPVLMRTSSLPTEPQEDWRKRKEMQSLRRMEAKRRRSEKQKNLNASLREELNLDEERRELLVNRGNWTPTWARQGVIGAMNVNRGSINLQGLAGQQQGSIGSVESQGGSSSGMSEMETRKDSHSCIHATTRTRERHYDYISGQVTLGSSSVGEARSSSSNQSLQERSNHEAAGSSGAKTNENIYRTSRPELENPFRKFDSSENRGREIGANAMEDMPCVFTKGDGPNGRRIEGILYKYGKGGDVRIMCICHGSFHSPAEFVKHAGGGDVDHPLRHIVVNPSETKTGMQKLARCLPDHLMPCSYVTKCYLVKKLLVARGCDLEDRKKALILRMKETNIGIRTLLSWYL